MAFQMGDVRILATISMGKSLPPHEQVRSIGNDFRVGLQGAGIVVHP